MGYRKLLRQFTRNRLAILGAILTFTIVLIAIAAPLIAPYDPTAQDIINRFSPPSSSHFLGTDQYGRDLFSRIIYGSRASLIVGFSSVIFSIVVGCSFGMLCAYKGGIWDASLVKIIDVMMTFPTLLLGLLILAILGGGLFKTVIAIGIAFTPRFARIARGSALSVKNESYIEATKAMGANLPRIIFRHMLPNISGPITVIGTLWVGTAIRTAAGLNYLGLGVQPPTPSWGGIIRAGVDRIMGAPWVSAFAGLAIMMTIIGFNMMGDGLRDIIDPKLRA